MSMETILAAVHRPLAVERQHAATGREAQMTFSPTTFAGQKFAVVGLGRNGLPAAR